MDAMKEFKDMEFLKVIDAEEVINGLSKEELDKYSSTLGQFNILKGFLNYIGRSVDNLYFKKYCEIEYFYFDGTFLTTLNPNINDKEFDDYKEYFLGMEERFLKSYNEGKISNLSKVIDKRLRPFMYRVFYPRLSEEQKFKGFVDIYKFCENPQQAFPINIISEIRNYVPNYFRETRKSSELIDKDGYISIFRGNGSKSTQANVAMSWSTDLKTAKFFAYRYDNDGHVVKGKVHINDVIMIYDKEYCQEDEDYKDPEKEILVVPGSVKGVKKVKTSKGK
jgi:hypothetical protein